MDDYRDMDEQETNILHCKILSQKIIIQKLKRKIKKLKRKAKIHETLSLNPRLPD